MTSTFHKGVNFSTYIMFLQCELNSNCIVEVIIHALHVYMAIEYLFIFLCGGCMQVQSNLIKMEVTGG